MKALPWNSLALQSLHWKRHSRNSTSTPNETHLKRMHPVQQCRAALQCNQHHKKNCMPGKAPVAPLKPTWKSMPCRPSHCHRTDFLCNQCCRELHGVGVAPGAPDATYSTQMLCSAITVIKNCMPGVAPPVGLLKPTWKSMQCRSTHCHRSTLQSTL